MVWLVRVGPGWCGWFGLRPVGVCGVWCGGLCELGGWCGVCVWWVWLALWVRLIVVSRVCMVWRGVALCSMVWCYGV